MQTHEAPRALPWPTVTPTGARREVVRGMLAERRAEAQLLEGPEHGLGQRVEVARSPRSDVHRLAHLRRSIPDGSVDVDFDAFVALVEPGDGARGVVVDRTRILGISVEWRVHGTRVLAADTAAGGRSKKWWRWGRVELPVQNP